MGSSPENADESGRIAGHYDLEVSVARVHDLHAGDVAVMRGDHASELMQNAVPRIRGYFNADLHFV